jgi:hypothetical protein
VSKVIEWTIITSYILLFSYGIKQTVDLISNYGIM